MKKIISIVLIGLIFIACGSEEPKKIYKQTRYINGEPVKVDANQTSIVIDGEEWYLDRHPLNQTSNHHKRKDIEEAIKQGISIGQYFLNKEIAEEKRKESTKTITTTNKMPTDSQKNDDCFGEECLVKGIEIFVKDIEKKERIEEVKKLYTKACNDDYFHGCHLMGTDYYQGTYFKEDKKEAFKWFDRAWELAITKEYKDLLLILDDYSKYREENNKDIK